MGNYVFTMPDVGEGIAEVEVMEWNVKVGDKVEEDDLLCAVMTDKAMVEIPSPVAGHITWIGPDAGDVLAVGADLLHLLVEVSGDTNGEHGKLEADIADPRNIAVEDTKTIPLIPGGQKPISSPALRKRAREAGVDLQLMQGTGPANRITDEDLDRYIADKMITRSSANIGLNTDTSVTEIKIIGLRRKIAATLQDTMQRIPHFTYVEEIDVTELEALRAHLNKNRRKDQPKLTMLPFLIKALVKAVKVYPQMGSRFDDKAGVLHQYDAAHIGIATQTASGLVVPVVKHAETLDIWRAANEVKRLADAARNGSATKEELSGSTITISSLGSMGGIATTPVINSPEVAIIGVNKVAIRPLWQNGAFVPKHMMNLSSSFDHRIIDGWDATQFVHHIKGNIESPANLFMGE
jgi:2-oxoisovalerate dehydrogenase E2 component (dihydrolipoyl transacylase)